VLREGVVYLYTTPSLSMTTHAQTKTQPVLVFLSCTKTQLLICFTNPTRSVLFFSRPQSEGWPHHGRTFSIYLCPPSFRLTLPRNPRGVLSTYWCCPSRLCVVFLACAHLAFFLALSLSTGNYLVPHGMLASSLWQYLTVPSLQFLALLRTHSFVFFAVHETRRILPLYFTNPALRSLTFSSPTGNCLHWLLPGPFLLSYLVFVFSFPNFFAFLCRALD